jgi:hypothetical protein
MNDTQLLCTFVSVDMLATTVDTIRTTYTLAFNNVYILENTEDPSQLILTYNVVLGSLKAGAVPPPSTISVHRKKQTNTIYTINALNALIAGKNNGQLDRAYKVEWNDLRNSVLVTAHGKLKIVKTKIQQIINF